MRKLQDDWIIPNDYRLEPGSPAINVGVAIPEDRPDPLREQCADQPDLGALPYGADHPRVGIRGLMAADDLAEPRSAVPQTSAAPAKPLAAATCHDRTW